MLFLRYFLLIFIILLEAACAWRNNLAEGITCFRRLNYRQAFIHLKPEAEKGQPDAQYAVGYMYYYGQGVTEDRRQACVWISRAAKAGQPDAIRAMRILRKKPVEPTIDPLDPLIYHRPP